ncbi:hypothetical protein ABID22_000344 [Pontibacter aydingkolensis]|uniref:Uncharacterized protein n=1 Tax=Pontibacter aydingkolensis TaxID=1911536 RepID=A0ABS7CQK2_9BACT|nr:hypothetical protein [Pontibacter aydingkolensis]MBW7465991.1 hypothetical protein [Pontibacter aydingkolensis]
MIKEYIVNIIREPGEDPLSGEFYPFEHEELKIEATSIKSAYDIACAIFKMKVRGQLLRFFIDGKEYFDDRF